MEPYSKISTKSLTKNYPIFVQSPEGDGMEFDMKIAILLADGFEEVEALTPIDLLRRANLDLDIIGIEKELITGAHGIKVFADIISCDADASLYNAVILPGGMPGTLNLDKSDFTDRILNSVASKNGRIAAICAAPLILGKRDLLKGKEAICYPGFEGELIGASLSEKSVVTDGLITTAKGMGVALDFAKELVALFCGEETMLRLSEAIME